MFRLLMLHNINTERGARSVVSRSRFGPCKHAAGLLLPVARCNRHAGWMHSSAAEGRQVSGNEMLSHIAAVHGISAHSHGGKQQCCCSHTSFTSSQAPATSALELQHARMHGMHFMGQARSSCKAPTGRQESKAAAAAAAAVPAPPPVCCYAFGPLPAVADVLASRLSSDTLRQVTALRQHACSPSTASTVAAAAPTAAAAACMPGLRLAELIRRPTGVPCGTQDQHLLPVLATAATARTGWPAGQQQQQYTTQYHTGHSRSSSRYISGPQKSVSQMSDDEKHELLVEKLIQDWTAKCPEWEPTTLPILKPGGNRGTNVIRCPACGNGDHMEDCFRVTVEDEQILWCCHRQKCQFQGRVALGGEVSRSASNGRGTAAPTTWAGTASQQAWQGQELHVRASSGAASRLPQQQQQKPATPAPGTMLQKLSPEFLQWFEKRGISAETLQRNGVAMEIRGDENAPHIAHPFYKDGNIVNVKYRQLPKKFHQTKGGEQIMYGFDDAKGASEIIIVEGEMDKLSVEEALLVAAKKQLQQQQQEQADGSSSTVAADDDSISSMTLGERPLWWKLGRHTAVLSVPAGATTGKMDYLAACQDLFKAAERVVIAVDNDGPGLALAQELARRVGRAMCWIVEWPNEQQNSLAPTPPSTPPAAATTEAAAGLQGAPATEAAGAAAPTAAATASGSNKQWFRKDANEVLVLDGPEILLRYMDEAAQVPIKGLFGLDAFSEEVFDLYKQGAKGLNFGVTTGWDSLDAYYKVVPGELTLVTGYPGSGKSEWLDALTVNLANLHGWTIAMCSLENKVTQHAVKLIEKTAGKPFAEGPKSHGKTRMTKDEFIEAFLWVDSHFHVIQRPPDASPSIDYILDNARDAVLRYGIRGLVIDPYNELDHRRAKGMTETEHVSRMLTKIKRFAQQYNCHVWFVAHPRTIYAPAGGTHAPPNLYDMSGSANFVNKADNGIVVHRPWFPGQEGGDPTLAHLLVRKVRNKLAGAIGDCYLRYEPATGRYIDDVDQDQE